MKWWVADLFREHTFGFVDTSSYPYEYSQDIGSVKCSVAGGKFRRVINPCAGLNLKVKHKVCN